MPADVSERGKRIFTPMKPAEKRKGRASDTAFDAKQSAIDKRHTVHDFSAAGHLPSQPSPVGCRWHSNSCAYDATLFVIYNMWNLRPVAFSVAFNEMRNDWLPLMAK